MKKNKLLEMIVKTIWQGISRTVLRSSPRSYMQPRMQPRNPPTVAITGHTGHMSSTKPAVPAATPKTENSGKESDWRETGAWVYFLLFGASGFTAGVAYALTVVHNPPVPSKESAISLGTGVVGHHRVEENFVAAYNSATRNPSWVAELYTKDSLIAHPGVSREGVEFKEEDSLPTSFRARLSSYVGSGYDRGHMAPAAAHRSSKAGLAATFSLSNVAPQHPSLNREYWARIEKWARELVRREGGGGRVHVVTGPLYLPSPHVAASPSPSGEGGKLAWEFRYPALGDPFQWISVPTHFFKVVCWSRGEGDSDGLLVAAFVLPNSAVSSAMPLSRFSVPLTLLEAVSGISFLPLLVTPQDKLSLDWQWQTAFPGDQASLGLDFGLGGLGGLPAPALQKSTSKSSIRHLCTEHGACDLPPSNFFELNPS